MRKVILLFVILVLMSGCATLGAPTGPSKDLDEAALLAHEKKFQEAAAVYKKIQKESPQTLLAAEAVYGTALLHASPDNPQKDYAQAIRLFEDFLKQHPGNRREHEAREWVSLLKAIQELRKENERLKMNIEQLQQLDIRHEERRRK